MATNRVLSDRLLAVTLMAAFMSAWWSSRTAFILARAHGREEKRQFCFDLQSQFDSPEMFQCRFKAWKKLDQGDFEGIENVSSLRNDSHWTYEVSTVIHFFESLNRYCDESLVDPGLAVKLFDRSYELWYQRVLNRLKVDKAAESYSDWYEGIRAFHVHVEHAAPKRLSPLPNATPAQAAVAQ